MQTISVVTKRCRRNWACSGSARRRKVTSLGCAAAALPSAHLRLPGCCTRSSPGAGWASASGSRSFFKRIFVSFKDNAARCWATTMSQKTTNKCQGHDLGKNYRNQRDIVAPTVFYLRKTNKTNKLLMTLNQHSELVKKQTSYMNYERFDGNVFVVDGHQVPPKHFQWWSFSNPFKWIWWI